MGTREREVKIISNVRILADGIGLGEVSPGEGHEGT